MKITTPGCTYLDMIDLTDFVRVNVVAIVGEENWELRAYQTDHSNDDGVVIKVGPHAELESLMAAIQGTMIHPSFAPTTPTFH